MPAVVMNRAIKYRAYPNDQQAELLAKTFGCVRFVWNRMLNDAQDFESAAGVFFVPTPAKYKKEFPFLKEVDSLALANTQLSLHEARSKFLKEPNVGAPKFKSKKKCKAKYTTNCVINKKKNGAESPTITLGHDFVHIPKVGDVKINKHRLPGKDWKIRSATIERTKTGKYFISVLFEFAKEVTPVVVKEENALGLDYSSHDFYVDSNGNAANYPRFYRKSEEKLAEGQRKLSRMKYGSKNYEKQLRKIRLLHEKIANQRKNFCHTLSTAIAKQYDAVYVEDLNLQNLAQTLKLGKSTNDNGFGMFRVMLQYKLEAQGKTFAKVNKWYPSSKTCHVCGFVKEDLTLADRVWTCSSCGTVHNRDHNAAINIRHVGFLGAYPA